MLDKGELVEQARNAELIARMDFTRACGTGAAAAGEAREELALALEEAERTEGA